MPAVIFLETRRMTEFVDGLVRLNNELEQLQMAGEYAQIARAD